MTCPFSSKEEVYQHACKFLRSNPSKSEIENELSYLQQQGNVCTGEVKNAIVEVSVDLVDLYFGDKTLSSLIDKYCKTTKATLNISTNPSGANVYVDGEYKGTT